MHHSKAIKHTRRVILSVLVLLALFKAGIHNAPKIGSAGRSPALSTSGQPLTSDTEPTLNGQTQDKSKTEDEKLQLKREGPRVSGGLGSESLGAALSAARHSVLKISESERQSPLNQDAHYFAANPGQQLTARFTPEGVRLGSGYLGHDWAAKLQFSKDGVSPTSSLSLSQHDNRVVYRHEEGITEWYENKVSGFEHGFHLKARPAWAGEGELVLHMITSGVSMDHETNVAHEVTSSALRMVASNGQALMRYSDLKVWDATGRTLAAQMSPTQRGLAIRIDDSQAVYPLMIDPLITSLEQTLTPGGGGDGSANDNFGQAVTILDDTAVMGAPNDDTAAGANAGSVYVFKRAGSIWSLEGKLVAGDGAPSDSFGNAVAVSVDTVIVGAEKDGQTGISGHGSAYIFVRSSGAWSQQAKLVASDLAANDNFGHSVALSGNSVLIGSVSDDLPGANNAGSVYAFVRVGTSWSQQSKLTASDAQANDLFGQSVALEGDTALVGANTEDPASVVNAGSAYVFVRSGTTWTQSQKLTDPTPGSGDNFGWSVSLSGDSALIGCYLDDAAVFNGDEGSASVFIRNEGTWTFQAKLTASDASSLDKFGHSVSLSGDVALIGAPDDVTNVPGSAYLFRRISGVWSQEAKWMSSDVILEENDWGFTVALNNGTAVIGSPKDDADGGINAGSVSVYVYDSGNWTLQSKITAGAGNAEDEFGVSVAYQADTAVVGAHKDDSASGVDVGAGYVFTRTGNVWSEQARLTQADPVAGDRFGVSVAMDAETILVGASGKDTARGSGYVFTRAAGVWSQQAKLNASDRVDEDSFGASVSLSGNTALLGAYGDDVLKGSAYVFLRTGTTWAQQTKLVGTGTVAGDFYGISVSVQGNTAVVGADVPGSVFVYLRTGTTWAQQQKLNPSPVVTGGGFGVSVSLSQESVLIGANGENTYRGAAYVFTRTGTVWTQQARLQASDGVADDTFGNSVSLDGDRALIGAPRDDSMTGSAHLFSRTGNVWTSEEKFSLGGTGDSFGQSIALKGDTAVVGAFGDHVVNPLTGDLASRAGSVHVFRISAASPEIEVEQPISNLLVDGVSSVSFGNADAGQSVQKSWQIRNVGTSNLNSLNVMLSGAHANQFSVTTQPSGTVVPTGTTTFLVTFTPTTPGVKNATLQVISNDGDESPFDVALTGRGLTAQETWREDFFGSIENTGTGADQEDFDHDGMINLLEFALALDPTLANSNPGMLLPDSGAWEFRYARSKLAVTLGFTFIVEWSDSLAANDWHVTGVTQEILSDNGTLQQMAASIPAGGNDRRFVRVRVVGL